MLELLNEWRDFVYDLPMDQIRRQGGKHMKENRPEYATSVEYLNALRNPDHDHEGFPEDSWGVDLNQISTMFVNNGVKEELYRKIKDADIEFDDEFSALLGSRFCALKMWYPPQGYIGWHTNWNVPGYNVIFTYNPNGDGYWRHISPETGELVHIPDPPGWHCKTGYYGAKKEPEKVIWHSAYTGPSCTEGRITLGYVIFDETLWRMMSEELETEEDEEFGTNITHYNAPIQQ